MKSIETDWKWNSGLSKRASTKYIALHHAQCSICTAAAVDGWHKANGWSGIGYHFFVRKDGSVYRGRPLDTMGAHVSGMNNCSIGICAEGAYMKEIMPYTQKKAIAELIDYLKTNYYPSAEIVGHREIGASDCPGTNYPLAELKNYKSVLGKESEDNGMTIEEKERMDAIDASLTNLYKIVENLTSSIGGIKDKLDELTQPDMVYNYIDDNMPVWAREGVQYCVDNGIITGTGDGLGLDDKDLRYCTMIARMLQNLKLG